MLETWKCNNCRLVFPVGWYHYSIGSRPFWAATLLTCRQCGTAHAIEHASRNSAEKHRFYHLPEPYIDDDDSTHTYDDDDEESVLTMKWYMGPSNIANWLMVAELEVDDHKILTCAHCGTTALTNVWNEDDVCPSCRSAMESVSAWIT